MHYHTASPQSDDYDDAADEHSALTSQTLNPDGTPKRPMNAFMIFARRRRPQVSAENQSMRTGDISKILSTEWKAMLPTEKQFYLAQAKQLKDTFNKKYPEYVYRRRPNNTRKKRPSPSTSSSANAPSPDDAESNSSPDADAHPALPDPSSSRYPAGPYDQRHYSSPYASSSFGGGGGSYGGGGYGHARTQSYNPYPPASSSSGDAYRYESPRSQQLLNSPYYPPYDHNAPLPSAPLHGGGGLGSPSLGLRKAHSMASMPSGALSPPLGHHHHTHSASAASTSSTSHPHSPLPSSPYYPAAGHAQPASYSPPTRYSPYASASSSHSSSHSSSATSASPVPAPHATAYAAGSPPAQYGDYPPSSTSSTFSSSSSGYSSGSPYMGANGGAPRALTLPNPNTLGLSGGGLGMGGGGIGGGLGVGAGDDFYWRADKLL